LTTSSRSESLKIADLACGNGVWLTELHSHLAKANIPAQLDGFDINPVNFPDAAYLPASVSLQKLDIFTPDLPAEIIGVYDVVHIRALVSVIPNESTLTRVFSIASKLLKPGGFLQWEETRGDKFIAEAPSQQVTKTASEGIIQILQGSLQQRGIRNDWVDALDTHLEQFGFQNTRLLVQEKRKQDYKGWTEDYLMVWEELADLFPTKAQAPGAPLTREAWVDMFAMAVGETEQGVVVHQARIMTAVGQKPQ
jgi:SAM-dependent methyltransferase